MPSPADPPSVVARLRRVGVVFPGCAALEDVDLDVRPGEVTALAGPNGAGKTTLLEVVAGTRSPTAGTRTATRSIAFVPQRTSVSDRLPVTVHDVVTVGTWGRGAGRPGRRAVRGLVADSLGRLGISGIADRSFATLSGGQRQRALLAQGLAGRTGLLLLDEPTTGLDEASSRRIRQVLREEAHRGAAVLCVSHDPEMLATADRTVRLDGGRVVEEDLRA